MGEAKQRERRDKDRDGVKLKKLPDLSGQAS